MVKQNPAIAKSVLSQFIKQGTNQIDVSKLFCCNQRGQCPRDGYAHSLRDPSSTSFVHKQQIGLKLGC